MRDLRNRLGFAVLASALVACGGGAGRGAESAGPNAGHRSGGNAKSGGGAGEPEVVEEKVTYQRMPDGSVKKTTTRTTRKYVEAPPPPARPADPFPGDSLVRYNVERVNAYRAEKGLTALLYDAKISAFATDGSERLAKDHVPHAHFAANAQGAPGFGSRSAENQGDPNGVPSLAADATTNGKKQVDVMLKMMMDEGPGGGHYENIVNPRFRRIGIGLVYASGRLYMTNDFSD